MSENVTKEGIEVKIGQVWLNLDKRMGKRHCKVTAVAEGKAAMVRCYADGVVFRTTAKTRISVRRMHKSSTGWTLALDAK